MVSIDLIELIIFSTAINSPKLIPVLFYVLLLLSDVF